MTIIHTAIWFVYSLGGQFICHGEPPNVQRGHASTAHDHLFDTGSSDEDDDDEPHNTDDHDEGDQAPAEPELVPVPEPEPEPESEPESERLVPGDL